MVNVIKINGFRGRISWGQSMGEFRARIRQGNDYPPPGQSENLLHVPESIVENRVDYDKIIIRKASIWDEVQAGFLRKPLLLLCSSYGHTIANGTR